MGDSDNLHIAQPRQRRHPSMQHSQFSTFFFLLVLAPLFQNLNGFCHAFSTPSSISNSMQMLIPHPAASRPSWNSLRGSSFCTRVQPRRQIQRANYPWGHRQTRNQRGQMGMFLGQDAGIFGVGAPEVITIVLVGYFVLGPSDLYKLTKEIGKFITNVRTLGAEASASFEGAMENQLALDEIRKAQSELTDAFSFRRSINYQEGDEAFSKERTEKSGTSTTAAAATATATATAATGTKKKKRRRVKKRPVQATPPAGTGEGAAATAPSASSTVEDLDMSSETFETLSTMPNPPPPVTSPSFSSDSEMAEQVLQQQEQLVTTPTAEENNRFQAQMDAQAWNDAIMEKEDDLAPLGTIMKKLAMLEEERTVAMARLEEEFRMKEELEESYYRRKRALLEEAAVDVQMGAYAGSGGGSGAETEGEMKEESTTAKTEDETKEKEIVSKETKEESWKTETETSSEEEKTKEVQVTSTSKSEEKDSSTRKSKEKVQMTAASEPEKEEAGSS